MRRLFLAVPLLLIGCGNEPTGEVTAPAPKPAGEAAAPEAFGRTGHLETSVYLPAGGMKPRSGELLPITVTDGEGFRVQLPGELAGETVFLEIDGVAREIELSVSPGDTLFLTPR